MTDDDGQQRVSARVYPALVPLTHPLAAVNGAFNAVVVEAEAAGRLMFYGQGAGGNPTASAVMGDVVMAARNRVQGGRARVSRSMRNYPFRRSARSPLATTSISTSRIVLVCCLLLQQNSAKREVSIAEVRQEGVTDANGVPCGARIVVVTHRATDAALSETVAALTDLDVVQAVNSVLRLEGTAE